MRDPAAQVVREMRLGEAVGHGSADAVDDLVENARSTEQLSIEG